ncbi:hypothetical protein MMC25_005789 [Agyrium rufum]|nr:hypothetical protein [Agyrium rufum]
MTAPPIPLPQFLYKILPTAPSHPLPHSFPLAPIDAKDGFVHLSTATQVPATAARFFADRDVVWLLRIPRGRLEGGGGGAGAGAEVGKDGAEEGISERMGKEKRGELKWEESRSHGVFPHLYGRGVEGGDVERVIERRRGEGEGWEVILGDLEG